MNRLYYILLVITCITSGVHAQTEILNKRFMDDVRFNKITTGKYMPNSISVSDVMGTPYLSEKFETGKITTKEGVVYENISLRYNAFRDDIEFKQGEEIYNIDIKTTVKKAEFGGNIFSCRSFEKDGKIRDGFFKVLNEGKAVLLVKYTIIFLESEEAKAFSDPQPARFDQVFEQYFLTIEGAPAKLISNKKSLLGMFGDKKGEMESYISKNKLSIKNEYSLMNMIAHFNSL